MKSENNILEQKYPANKYRSKWRLFSRSLLLKQTLKATWKNKLQLVTLLLLSAFCTTIITGSWIAYDRLQSGWKFMGMDNSNFNAVLSYNPNSQSSQMANQAFSLSLGRLYAPASLADSSIIDNNNKNFAANALYFDDTRIGKEIKKIYNSDVRIIYKKEGEKITGVENIVWTDTNKPLKFDITDENVKGSIYGQLRLKANSSSNLLLKKYYTNAADNLYNAIFKAYSLPQIESSIKSFLNSWINNNNIKITSEDLTSELLKKINYQSAANSSHDYTIPHEVNVITSQSSLWERIVKENDQDPRAKKGSIGMNGQWMKIRRKFDNNNNESQKRDFKNWYLPLYNNNIISDVYYNENKLYTHHIMAAVAALQNHDIRAINQFSTTVGIDQNTNKTINAKIVKLGFKSNYNNVDLKIFEGLAPVSKDQVVISPQYARKHYIKPGDNITINNFEFMVSGIGGDAFNIYPRTNTSDVMPDAEDEYIAYVLPDTYNNNNWIEDPNRSDNSTVYFLPWQNIKTSEFQKQTFDDYFQKNIFAGNGVVEDYQNEYVKYLSDKYGKNLASPELKSFKIFSNGIINSQDSEFGIYNSGRIIFFTFIKVFFYTIIIGILFLTFIVSFITFLIVKKNVQNNQASLGILKATGYKTSQLALTYSAYAILTLLIAIPLGWIMGVGVTYYFTGIFNSLFLLPYNIFSISFIPLLISIALIIGFVCITAIGSAYNKLQKNTLFLIRKDNDISIGQSRYGTLQRIFEQSFKIRFLLSLTKTSWKKITITSTVIGLATLAISTSLSLPASINRMNTDYFKSQKYNNYYKYQTPTPNMPLSKYGLSSWTNLDNINHEKYYPVAGISPFVSDIIIKDNQGNKLAWFNPIEYKKGENDFNKIIHLYSDKDLDKKQKLVTQLQQKYEDKKFGPLDADLLTWSFTWLGGRGFSNKMIEDLKNEDKTNNQEFSQSVIKIATALLPDLLQTEKATPDSEDPLIEILKKLLPGYSRQILDKLQADKWREGDKNFDAYSNFSIGHNSISINPTYNSNIDGPQEELVTQVNLAAADAKLNSHGFMDVLGINPNTKMLKMNNDIVNKMKYQQNQNVIPVVINKAFSARYRIYEGAQFNAYPSINTLYYRNKNDEYLPIAKNSWFYGENPLATDSNTNIWSMTANKWNYRGDQNLSDGYKTAFGYNYDGEYNEKGKQIFYEPPEEWNDINKVWLKLPEDISSSAYSGKIRGDQDGNGDFDLNENEKVSKKDGNSIWIRPFSFNVTKKWKAENPDPLQIMNKKIPQWYGGMIEKGVLVKKNNIEETSIKNDLAKMPTWWDKIIGHSNPVNTYKVVGVQASYDTPRAFIDQQWANRISGYTNTNGQDPKTLGKQYQWFNGKLSSADNIYDLIARYSVRYISDDYTLYGSMNHKQNYSVPFLQNAELLSKKQEVLSKMASLAFMISGLFVLVIIICSIVIVIMITDSFTGQFRRFMAHMKSEGYTNWEINSFTLGIFTPWALIGYLIGYGAGYLLFFALLQAISYSTSLVFPFAFIWWIIPLSFFLIFSIYASTFIINNKQINKMNLIEILKTEE